MVNTPSVKTGNAETRAASEGQTVEYYGRSGPRRHD